MARKYSKVERHTWRDIDFRNLSLLGKQLWLYLLTSPLYTSIPGLLPASLTMVADEMGESLSEGFREALQSLVDLGWVKVDSAARLILLPNATRHNLPESPNVIKGWAVHFDEIPDSPLKDEWLKGLEIVIAENPGKDNCRIKVLSEGFEKAIERLSKGFRIPDPSPKPFPDPSPETGGAPPPVDHQNKYDGETENDAQKIVALIVATWDNWPQDQVEPSVMRLRAADPELTLEEWAAIIKEAHRTTRPGESATRLHTWLARQISIYKKDQTTGGKRETPQQRERREQLERAKQRCIDAEEKEENNGDGKVRVSGVADFLGRISPDGDDRRSTGAMDATPGRDK